MNPVVMMSPQEVLDVNRLGHKEGFVAGVIFSVGALIVMKGIKKNNERAHHCKGHKAKK